MSLNLKSFPQKDEALNWSCKCSIIRNIFHFTFMIPVQSLPVSKISKNAWIKSKRSQAFKLRCPTVLAPVSAWRVNQSLVVGGPVILGGWTHQNAILISPPHFLFCLLPWNLSHIFTLKFVLARKPNFQTDQNETLISPRSQPPSCCNSPSLLFSLAFTSRWPCAPTIGKQKSYILGLISPYIKTRHNLITWLSMRIIKDPKISQARTKRSPTIGLNIANLLRVAAFPFVFLPTNFIGLQVTSTVSHLPNTFCDQKSTLS